MLHVLDVVSVLADGLNIREPSLQEGLGILVVAQDIACITQALINLYPRVDLASCLALRGPMLHCCVNSAARSTTTDTLLQAKVLV